MDRDVNIVKYLPPVIGNTLEFIEICKTEDIELSELWTNVDRVRDENYIESMTEYGVTRTEKMLGLKPYDTDTIADRKFRIKAYSNSDLPYTIRALRNMLNNLVGESYILTVDSLMMTVKIGLGEKKQFMEVQKLLERVVPANVAITVDLLYNTHGLLGAYTHAQLSGYTHGELREQVLNTSYLTTV